MSMTEFLGLALIVVGVVVILIVIALLLVIRNKISPKGGYNDNRR